MKKLIFFTAIFFLLHGCMKDNHGPETTPLPIANFVAAKNIVKVAEIVHFEDASVNAERREWVFEGGEPRVSTELNPTIKYSEPGTYGVRLTVWNEAGEEDTKVRNNYIEVENNTELKHLDLSPILRFCPEHIRGDREFAGHGPLVSVEAKLEIEGDQIYLVYTLHAVETERDYTEALRTKRELIYTAPPRTTILSIESDTWSRAKYTDDDHDLDYPDVTGGLVKYFEILGDTGGDDVGNCTSDDVYMNIYFNTISILLKNA